MSVTVIEINKIKTERLIIKGVASLTPMRNVSFPNNLFSSRSQSTNPSLPVGSYPP